MFWLLEIRNMNAVDELDLLLHDAPQGVLDSWRVVRAHLRRKKVPSQSLEAAIDDVPTKPGIPSTTEHFRAATSILKKAGE